MREEAVLSRDERKNQHIMKLFERQEKLKQRREDKKKNVVSKNPTSVPDMFSKPSDGEQKPIVPKQKPIPIQKHHIRTVTQHGRVKISLMFANNVHLQHMQNRYFFE